MAQPPQEQGVRYSQGANKPIGAAAVTFSWEHPIPQTKFWDDLPYTVARNFLSLFDAAASDDPPPSFDDDDGNSGGAERSTLSKTEKLQLLLRLLHDRLASRDRDAAPHSQTFYEADCHA
ncbi:hypothetical protein C8A01DRAFT_31022 [Parachaetomium inaequale]|uniref:Uncharacterized protein n=1 Tax=Parachaetomium inaequale TaxID=2588326 RepID=A0AAN6PTZ7_9PEZI|nr:hypothetical protein C8A01DRAFT_31022 [Parachaetomium inaequale]